MTTTSANVSHSDVSLSDARLEELAQILRTAEETRTPCPMLTDVEPGLTLAHAYAIQKKNIARRLARGRSGARCRVVGHKVGITSKAVMEWLRVDQPDFGHLLDEMWVPDQSECKTELLLQPRIEGEIAFVLGSKLMGPGLTVVDVIRAIDCALPALEIIDSRVAEWKILVQDTIADNASSGMFVLGGPPVSIRGLDLVKLGMTMRKNGAVVSTGAGINCLGNPLNAVVWLANTLGALGEALEPGHVVLSGALGPVSPVAKGDVVELAVADVGSARVIFG
jgi:2-oxopent-4-enoate hydratase